MAALGPVFDDLDPAGVADFRAVFLADFERVMPRVYEAGERDPDFAEIVRTAFPAAARAAITADWLQVVRRGFEGDWGSYESAMCARSHYYARAGIPLAGALGFLRSMQHEFTPVVVDAFGGDAARINRALAPLRRFFDWCTQVMANAYVGAREDTFRAAEIYSEAVLSVAQDGVFSVDTEGRITALNPAFEQIFDCRREDALGRTVASFLAPEERQGHTDRVRRAVQEGRLPATRLELIALRGGTVRFPAEFSIVMIQLRGKMEFSAFVRDLTSAHVARDDLQEQRDKLAGSEERLRALAGRLHAIREEEGRRIGREIHDVLGQSLTALKLDAAWLLRNPDAAVPDRRARIEAMLRLLDAGVEEVQRISTELRPSVLEDLGLRAALQSQAREFRTRTGIEVELSIPEERVELPLPHSTALYRIFQETLTNVARHSDASRVVVEVVFKDGQTLLEVRDDGRGITLDEASRRTSLGVLGMRERALAAGGSFAIEGTQGQGTRVRVRIPLVAGAPRA